MSYDYSGLNSYFQKFAYDTVKKNLESGKFTNEALFKAADVNGDGVVDSKDKKLIDKSVTASNKDKKLFDVNGDGKITYEDLAKFGQDKDGKAIDGFDFDKDGKISDYEKKFLADQKAELQESLIESLKDKKNKLTFLDFAKFEEQKAKMSDAEKANLAEYEKELMKYVNSNTNFDLNKDGKEDFSDYAEFLKLTNGKFDNASKEVQEFLKKYKKRIATQSFDFYDNDKLGYGDLSKLANRVLNAEKYLKNKTKLTDAQMKKYDVDGDGDFDEKDVQAYKDAMSNYMDYLGIKDINGDGKLDAADLLKVNKDYNTAKANLEKANDVLSDLKADRKAVNTEKQYVDAIVSKKTEISDLNKAIDDLIAKKDKSTSASEIDKLNTQIANKRAELRKARDEVADLESKFKKKYPKEKVTDFEALQKTLADKLAVYDGTGEGSIKAAETKQKTANEAFKNVETEYKKLKGIETFIEHYKGK